MVSKKWIAQCCISLTVLSFYVPNTFAQQSSMKTDNCLVEQTDLSTNKNLRREVQDKTTLTHSNSNAKIASIKLKQLNVFNTELEEENIALFRFANRAHIQTEPDVINNLLLFSPGDKYDAKKLAESERLLRKESYLYDAQISATENCDGDVNVEVVTRDLWTLLPEVNFSRSGGENKSSIGFRESNLLGWGKRLSFSRTTDSDRSGYLFVYDDPNILSTRYRGRLEYADNSDGKRHLLELTYPFYAIDTPFSYGILSYSEQREESLYKRGEEFSEFDQTTDLNRVFIGHSKALNNNWTQRLTLGYTDEQHTFEAIDTTLAPLADDRSLSYPFISGHWFEDNYIKVRNFDSISRTEDLNLGWNIKSLIGYSDESLSNDDSRAVYSFNFKKAHFTNDNTLWRFSADIDGYWNKEQKKLENFMATSQVQYYLNTSEDQSWYVKARVQYAKNLTADQQLTLGGETGLRGYPMDYQHGDRSFLVNLEKRYYWEYDLLQLFKVGGAAFVDVGRAWFNDEDNGENAHVLKNVGVGLRLAPSRANSGTMIHIDIAAPVDSYDDVDSVQWLVSVKNTF
ncbi:MULTISPECIES: BamA/TamA family outer membrane protein [unclassified Pseudoalteromonas]|uniref:BamA/TamA family outer membrane protein n=1 Tax=unclassified Pseudoalteromonas TaxID=194690 RepID=UPI0015FF45CC|nr:MULTISPECIES: BamA/TamA family outer membrane protein [unclassified Pseudoalteromonas]MBB1349048.1 BamA/TamA family outer membrane protein [Pseudoalteromonas sp. SG45-3]MBB1359446.1 BamA/TamA family outer membrane protein [Pseudoalteromonas sp. SG45-6]